MCLMDREQNTASRNEQKIKSIYQMLFLRWCTRSPWWEATVSQLCNLPVSLHPLHLRVQAVFHIPHRLFFPLSKNHNDQSLVQGEHATVILCLNWRANNHKKSFICFHLKWFDVLILLGSVSDLMCILCLQLFSSSFWFEMFVFFGSLFFMVYVSGMCWLTERKKFGLSGAMSLWSLEAGGRVGLACTCSCCCSLSNLILNQTAALCWCALGKIWPVGDFSLFTCGHPYGVTCPQRTKSSLPP